MVKGKISKIKSVLLSSLPAIFLIAFLVGTIIYAWTEPTTAPPGGNVPAPINVSGTAQTKTGSLTVATNAGTSLRIGTGAFQLAKDGLSLAFKNNAGVTRMIIGDDGNVGIGTTAPADKLHIENGYVTIRGTSPTIRFRDTNNYAGFIHMNGNWMYFLSSAGPDATSWTKHGSYWPLRINMANDNIEVGGNVLVREGNVGIGTTNPAYKLDVQGGDTRIENLYLGGTGNEGSLHKVDQIIGYNDLRLYGDTTGGPDIYITADGNVGIGTTSPTQKLDVVGYVKGRSGLCIGNDCRTSWPSGGAPTDASYVVMGSNATLRAERVLTAGGGISISDGGANGNVTISHEDTSSQNSVNNSGNTFIQDISLDTYGHVTGLTSATVSETDPQVGTLTNGKWCTSDGSKINCTSDAPSGGIGGSGTANYIPKWTGSTSLGNSVIYQSGSNVGIGTTGPSHKLTVANSSNVNVLRLIGPYSWGHGAKLNFGDDDYVYIQEDQDDKLTIHAGSRIALTGNGNVGIGTTNPAYKLDVAGKVNATELCIAGDCQSSWPTGITDISNTLTVSGTGWDTGSFENVIDGDLSTYLGAEPTGYIYDEFSRSITLLLPQPVDIGIIAVKTQVKSNLVSAPSLAQERTNYFKEYVYSDSSCTEEVLRFSYSTTVSGLGDRSSFLGDGRIVLGPIRCIKIEIGFVPGDDDQDFRLVKLRIYEVKVYKLQ